MIDLRREFVAVSPPGHNSGLQRSTRGCKCLKRLHARRKPHLNELPDGAEALPVDVRVVVPSWIHRFGQHTHDGRRKTDRLKCVENKSLDADLTTYAATATTLRRAMRWPSASRKGAGARGHRFRANILVIPVWGCARLRPTMRFSSRCQYCTTDSLQCCRCVIPRTSLGRPATRTL